MLIKITFPNHGHGYYFLFCLTWWIINEVEKGIYYRYSWFSKILTSPARLLRNLKRIRNRVTFAQSNGNAFFICSFPKKENRLIWRDTYSDENKEASGGKSQKVFIREFEINICVPSNNSARHSTMNSVQVAQLNHNISWCASHFKYTHYISNKNIYCYLPQYSLNTILVMVSQRMRVNRKSWIWCQRRRWWSQLENTWTSSTCLQSALKAVRVFLKYLLSFLSNNIN